MVAYLLDTNVVSEPRKASPHPEVMAWMRRQADVKAEIYLSVLVVGEVRKGIDQVRPRDPRRADALEAWLASLVEAYADRILPITMAIAEEAGRMTAACRPPLIDGLMAATAKVHRLTFVTRNVADVARTGVPVVNPFEG
jgi:hypothetical protein